MMNGKLVALLGFFFGVAFLVAAGSLFTQMMIQRSWTATPVLAVQAGDSCNDLFHFVRSTSGTTDTLSYQVDGTHYTVKACLSMPTKTVDYNPHSPSEAVVDYGKLNWFFIGACLVFGIGLVYHGLFGGTYGGWYRGGSYRGLIR